MLHEVIGIHARHVNSHNHECAPQCANCELADGTQEVIHHANRLYANEQKFNSDKCSAFAALEVRLFFFEKVTTHTQVAGERENETAKTKRR